MTMQTDKMLPACQVEYLGSTLDHPVGAWPNGIGNVYICSRCPAHYITDIGGAVVYLYDPFDRPVCGRK